MYNTYLATEAFAKYHNIEIEYGLCKLKNPIADLVSENEFQLNFNSNHYVIVKLKPEFYIVFCDSTTFSISKYIENIKTIIGPFKIPTLFVAAELSTDVKIMNIIQNNKPQVNFMYAASFLTNPLKHISAPIVEKIDYEPIEKVILISKANLPIIPFVDPIAAWMRLVPGDVIVEKQKNIVSGLSTTYRHVI